MTFEEWKDAYGLVHEPNYSAFTEADCLAAFNAGYTAFANELCEKCGQTRQHAGGGCIHCIPEWCKDKVKEARAERDKALDALDEAATSLETLHLRSYGDESYLNHMGQVRGFAGSRARVAQEALDKVRKTNEP